MTIVASLLDKALADIRARGEYRAMTAAEIAPAGRLRRDDGRTSVDFSSNDYLGLSQHPLLKQRSCEWAERHGAGSGSSRLVAGTTPLHLAVEAKLAKFKGTEAALIFATGLQANATVLPALLKALPGVLVFTDRLIHASLHHGCAAAGARQIRFRHNDLGHLDALLGEHGDERVPRLIITESVFSMDGDTPDLGALAEIVQRHRAFLYLDEAHATGVLGPGGAGLSATMPGGADLVMGTFSKAFGSFGAYVAGSRLLCDYLVNACSGFIFTTAPPPAMLGAIDAALDLVPTLDAERRRLSEMGDHLRQGLRSAGFDVGNSTTQIVPVILGESSAALAVSRRLADKGMTAPAIRPPSVASGSSRLRLTLSAAHDRADIDHLLALLAPQ